MNLGRVLGRVVATIRAPGLEGQRFLVLQPLDAELRPQGPTLVACDVVGAGIGGVVHWVGGREAALALPQWFVPVDATVIGIVESATASGLPEGAAR